MGRAACKGAGGGRERDCRKKGRQEGLGGRTEGPRQHSYRGPPVMNLKECGKYWVQELASSKCFPFFFQFFFFWYRSHRHFPFSQDDKEK